jgi:hypothetical protein
MPNVPRILLRIAVALFLGAALCGGVLMGYRLLSEKDIGGRYQTMHGWQPISGRWNEHDGILSNENYGRGDMLIAQHSDASNYTISADIRFDWLFPETHYGDAGLVIRTSNPEQGVDSYQGYYAGIRPDEQTVVLGRASYDWHQLKTIALSTPVSVGTWYHLALSAKGCKLAVTVTPQSGATTLLEYEDARCLTSGVAGLRSFYAQASWRNVKVSSL